MAIYSFNAISNNNLGYSGLTVKELTGNNDMLLFINSFGKEKYILTSITVYSDNISQVQNSIHLIRNETDGNNNELVKDANLSNYQILNKVIVDTGRYEYDENCQINYNVEPLTTVKLTLQFDDSIEVKNALDSKSLLKKDTLDSKREEMGFKETEECSNFTPGPSKYLEIGEYKLGNEIFSDLQNEQAKFKTPEQDWKIPTISEKVEKITEKIIIEWTGVEDFIKKQIETPSFTKENANKVKQIIALKKQNIYYIDPNIIVALCCFGIIIYSSNIMKLLKIK